VDRIARALNVSSRDIGYAGLKDARAIARQVLSIQGVTEEQVMGLHLPNITVQWASRHGNKLRLGHLAANRFAIKIRDVTPTDVVKLAPVMEELQRRGMPNYFGEQRFGRRGDNDKRRSSGATTGRCWGSCSGPPTPTSTTSTRSRRGRRSTVTSWTSR
jgi:tRNA pseudouridine13 synthase